MEARAMRRLSSREVTNPLNPSICKMRGFNGEWSLISPLLEKGVIWSELWGGPGVPTYERDNYGKRVPARKI